MFTMPPLFTRIRAFFDGRRGLDALNRCLVILFFAAKIVIGFFEPRWLQIIPLVFLALFLFRLLSKNLSRRDKENEVFVKSLEWCKKTYSDLSSRFAERKTHRYFRCPVCKTKVRVPRGRGKIRITCPNCSAKFEKKT